MTHWLSVQELQESGLLQEVNRQFFHPLGLALAVHRDGDGMATLAGVLDGRDDEEGYVFEEFSGVDVSRGRTILVEQAQRLAIRRERLGFDIQPLPEESSF